VVPELTCYYYSFLIVMALLWHTRKEVGLALLAVTAATGFIDWAPTQFLPRVFPFSYLQMPTWLDEQYTWMSVATLVGIGYILYEFGFVPKSQPIPVAAAAPAGGDDDAPVRRKNPKSQKEKAGTGTKAPSARRKKR
ncbi:MAG: hypothetical protein ABJA82_17700, partial [Myxococcales bacterium]